NSHPPRRCNQPCMTEDDIPLAPSAPSAPSSFLEVGFSAKTVGCPRAFRLTCPIRNPYFPHLPSFWRYTFGPFVP
ncbi:hypothetical protein COCMIDRAFT_87439, partial [Bipolaris oryzae ATCC 44560]